MTLKEVKQVLKETTIGNYNNTEVRLTPVQKYQVFYSVVEDLFKKGTITKEQFTRWTTVY